MANPLASLGSILRGSGAPTSNPVDSGTGGDPPIGTSIGPIGTSVGIGGIGGIGGGGGSAQDGLGQINSGSQVIASAISKASSALGGGSGQIPQFKKGGEVKKKYTIGKKLNLDACGVSTALKNKKSSPKW